MTRLSVLKSHMSNSLFHYLVIHYFTIHTFSNSVITKWVIASAKVHVDLWIRTLITLYKYSIIINMHRSYQYIAVIILADLPVEIWTDLQHSHNIFWQCLKFLYFLLSLYRIMRVLPRGPYTASSSATAIAMSSTHSCGSKSVLLYARFSLQLLCWDFFKGSQEEQGCQTSLQP